MVVKKIIFFVLIGVFYLFLSLLSHTYTCNLSTNKYKFMLFIEAIIIALSAFCVSKIMNICPSGEHYDATYQKFGKFLGDKNDSNSLSNGFTISQGKLCRGGDYFQQGDSPRAKMCQEMSKSNNEEINRYDCGPGFVGMPSHKFEYTPISNNQWNNSRCNEPASSDVDNNSYL